MQVLDAVDLGQSALVCAPTSSGKTFISSYCMHRVLSTSKDGCLVFVAPTKALVCCSVRAASLPPWYMCQVSESSEAVALALM